MYQNRALSLLTMLHLELMAFYIYGFWTPIWVGFLYNNNEISNVGSTWALIPIRKYLVDSDRKTIDIFLNFMGKHLLIHLINIFVTTANFMGHSYHVNWVIRIVLSPKSKWIQLLMNTIFRSVIISSRKLMVH